MAIINKGMSRRSFLGLTGKRSPLLSRAWSPRLRWQL